MHCEIDSKVNLYNFLTGTDRFFDSRVAFRRYLCRRRTAERAAAPRCSDRADLASLPIKIEHEMEQRLEAASPIPWLGDLSGSATGTSSKESAE